MNKVYLPFNSEGYYGENGDIGQGLRHYHIEITEHLEIVTRLKLEIIS